MLFLTFSQRAREMGHPRESLILLAWQSQNPTRADQTREGWGTGTPGPQRSGYRSQTYAPPLVKAMTRFTRMKIRS
jgi:hypothetical protein